MFAGDQDISWVLHSLPLFSCSRANCLSVRLSLCPCQVLFWQLCTKQLRGMTNFSSPPVLISHSFQSVSQPAHINPSLATSPLLSCHQGPSSLSSFLSSGTFSPSRPVRVGEFHPQCGIPRLISRYAGMLGTGQRAVPVIPDSAWDYRVHLSKL